MFDQNQLKFSLFILFIENSGNIFTKPFLLQINPLHLNLAWVVVIGKSRVISRRTGFAILVHLVLCNCKMMLKNLHSNL